MNTEHFLSYHDRLFLYFLTTMGLFRCNDFFENSMGLIARKLHPEWFQGNLRKRFYFEGWYFKIIDKNSDNIYAIIPGIALNKRNNSSHSFIQILDGKTAEYHYIRFPIEDFQVEKDSFKVSIGPNSFSENHIHLEIDDDVQIKADLNFSNLIKLERTFFNPGVMAFFSWFPFMETKHGVVSHESRSYWVL